MSVYIFKYIYIYLIHIRGEFKQILDKRNPKWSSRQSKLSFEQDPHQILQLRIS